jgi:hypothetical protein
MAKLETNHNVPIVGVIHDTPFGKAYTQENECRRGSLLEKQGEKHAQNYSDEEEGDAPSTEGDDASSCARGHYGMFHRCSFRGGYHYRVLSYREKKEIDLILHMAPVSFDLAIVREGLFSN